MTLFEIYSAAAGYLQRGNSDLTVNGVDLGLIALNQTRQNAEQSFDFEFSRQLVQVTVDGVLGGSLDTAVIYGTTTVVNVGTIVDVGYLDKVGNLIPVDWTTTEESLLRQRTENPFHRQYHSGDLDSNVYQTHHLHGDHRFTFRNNQVYHYPLVPNHTFTLLIECYTLQADWTAANLNTGALPTITDVYSQTTDPHIQGAFWNNGSVVMVSLPPWTGGSIGSDPLYSDVWTTKGSQYLLWQTICELNYYFKAFVPRQEGNLGAPEKLAAAGLEQLKEYDAGRFNQNRGATR